jgi:pachytene checkpoint protein 2
MTQLIDIPALNGKEGPHKRVWEVTTLPCPKHARDWERILRCKPTKQTLRQYALHTKELAGHDIARWMVDLSGVVLLSGEPGVGKTTLANGFANEYAKILGKPTRLFTLQTQHLLSHLLGESSKELAKAFEPIRFAAGQGPCVLQVEEIEQISFARDKVITSSDPTDLVRFVDQLLEEIDSLQEFSEAVIIGTSNFSVVLDKAFVSRADLVLTVPLPDLQTRLAILQARCKTLQPLGLLLDGDELTAIAKAAEGLSGRTLGKLFPQTYFHGVAYEDMSVDDVLQTLSKSHMKEPQNAGS